MASTVSTSSALIAGAVVSDRSLFFEALRDPGYAAYVGYSDRRARRSPCALRAARCAGERPGARPHRDPAAELAGTVACLVSDDAGFVTVAAFPIGTLS
jgi:hypothetical protein